MITYIIMSSWTLSWTLPPPLLSLGRTFYRLCFWMSSLSCRVTKIILDTKVERELRDVFMLKSLLYWATWSPLSWLTCIQFHNLLFHNIDLTVSLKLKKNLKYEQVKSSPALKHTSYLSFFLHMAHFWLQFFSTQKARKSRQNRFHGKTA